MKRRGITYIYKNHEDLIIVTKILRYLTVIAHYYYILLVPINWPQNVTKLFLKRLPYIGAHQLTTKRHQAISEKASLQTTRGGGREEKMDKPNQAEINAVGLRSS